MVRGLMGGIGQALVAAGSQYGKSKQDEEDKLRRQAIEDKALGRQDTLWNRQTAEMQAEDDKGAQDILAFGDEKINPYAQLRSYLGQNVVPDASPPAQGPSQAAAASPEGNLPPAPASRIQGLMAPLQPGQPAQPMEAVPAQPVVPRGLVAPNGSVLSVQGSAPPAPRTAPVAAKPAAKPMDWAKAAFGDTVDYRSRVAAQIDALEPRYEAKRQQVDAATRQILAENSDAATAKMKLAAYNRQLQKDPEFQRLQSESSKLAEDINKGRIAEGAVATVQGLLTGDQGLLQRLGYGQGAKIERDPNTGLPGVRMPSGDLIGPQLIMAQALVKSGVMTPEKFMETVNKVAESENKWQLKMSEMENALKRAGMPRITINAGKENQDPQVIRSNRIIELETALAKLPPNDPRRGPIQEGLRLLKNPSERVDVEKEKVAAGSDKWLETRLGKKTDSAIKRFTPDPMDPRPINANDFRLMYGQLSVEDPAAADFFASSVYAKLPEDEVATIKAGNEPFWRDYALRQGQPTPAAPTRSLAPRATAPQPQPSAPAPSTPPLPPGFRIAQ